MFRIGRFLEHPCDIFNTLRTGSIQNVNVTFYLSAIRTKFCDRIDILFFYINLNYQTRNIVHNNFSIEI